MNNKEIVKDFYEIFTELSKSFSFPYGISTFEVMKLAAEIQRNRILKSELSAIYDIHDDIRYNRRH